MDNRRFDFALAKLPVKMHNNKAFVSKPVAVISLVSGRREESVSCSPRWHLPWP